MLCGASRLAPRSLVASGIFVPVAIITHLLLDGLSSFTLDLAPERPLDSPSWKVVLVLQTPILVYRYGGAFVNGLIGQRHARQLVAFSTCKRIHAFISHRLKYSVYSTSFCSGSYAQRYAPTFQDPGFHEPHTHLDPKRHMGPKSSPHPRWRRSPTTRPLANLPRLIRPSTRHPSCVCEYVVRAYVRLQLDGRDYAEVGCGSCVVWGRVGDVWDMSGAGERFGWDGARGGNEGGGLEEDWHVGCRVRVWRRVWGYVVAKIRIHVYS